MKQFQFTYTDDAALRRELSQIIRWRGANPISAAVFRIYSNITDTALIEHVCQLLDEAMPDAQYLGCTTNANIRDGALAPAGVTLSCTLFENETTRVEVLPFRFTEENAVDVARQLKAYCDANPWVGAVEMHATTLGMSLRAFCDEMGGLRDDVQVFGGGACNVDPGDMMTFVFAKGHRMTDRGIVFLLMGGPDFHTYSTFIAGWKPLKRRFRVTRADRQVLYELDGEPAFHIYQKFLGVDRNDQFVANTLEFPLFMDHNGIDVLRCPLGLNDDDSLLLATEVAEDTDVRLAFGDPATILRSIREDGQKIADFRPEVIQTFSCAARRFFWGDENVSDETILLNTVAPTSGFYTSGEFLRSGGDLNIFNITLVLIAMREGDPAGDPVNISDGRLDNIDSEKIPLIRRFVSFIDASTAELAELNRRLAIASITDGLTGLYNRTETERRIRRTLESRACKTLSIIMLDIDNFKRINDVYGHREGDRVIIALSNVLKQVMAGVPTASLGRWGGEEFMVILPDGDLEHAAALAESMRQSFAAISYETAGCQTVSIGVIQAHVDENADAVYSRVDQALYVAKENGKNQVATMR